MNVPAHDKYGCSNASRWLACPGSVAQAAGQESRPSRYAVEGTVAHEVAAAALAGAALPEAVPVCNRCNDLIVGGACRDCGGNEYTLDREMPQYLAEYVAFIASLRASHEILHEEIECRIQSRRWPDHGGTVDYYALYRDEQQRVWLHVVDLKYGRGIVVASEGNTQLQCYLNLALERWPNVVHLRATIVQPRAGDLPVTVEVSRRELVDLDVRIADAYLDSEALQAGDHCRWCPALATCTAAQSQVVEVLTSLDAEPEADFARRGDMLARWLELVPAMRHAITEIPRLAMAHLQIGGEISGWKPVQTFAHRSWVGDPEVVADALLGLGVQEDDLWERKLVSPTQLEKRGYTRAHLDALTHRPARGYTVVVATDKRPAVDFSAADFSPLEENEDE